MPFGLRKRKRFERTASFELPPGQWELAWTSLRRRDVLGRIALGLLAAVTVCVVIRGWDPPFPYRSGYVPPLDIAAAVPFSKADPVATAAAQEKARHQQFRYVYKQDAEAVVQLRAGLFNSLVQVAAAPSLEKLDPKVWKDFQLPLIEGQQPPGVVQQEEQFRDFHAALTPPDRLDRIENALNRVFVKVQAHGLLDTLSKELGPGNQDEINVYPQGKPELQSPVHVSDVLIHGTAIPDLLRRDPDLQRRRRPAVCMAATAAETHPQRR